MKTPNSVSSEPGVGHKPHKSPAESQVEYFVWVNPNDFMVKHNIGTAGGIVGQPPPSDFTPSDLLYVANKSRKMDFVVSPFHSNTLWHYHVEADLERYRYERHHKLPSRLFALFLFGSRKEALNYRRIHPEHVCNRILKRGVAVKTISHSQHDGAWIDFLRIARQIDEDSINHCWRGYWSGARMQDSGTFEHCGQPWSPKSFIETLFYGRIDFPKLSLAKSD